MSMIGNLMPISGWVPPKSDGEKLAEMTAQRDELLEALKVAQLLICSEWCGAEYHAKPCRNASAAIAKAEQP